MDEYISELNDIELQRLERCKKMFSVRRNRQLYGVGDNSNNLSTSWL